METRYLLCYCSRQTLPVGQLDPPMMLAGLLKLDHYLQCLQHFVFEHLFNIYIPLHGHSILLRKFLKNAHVRLETILETGSNINLHTVAIKRKYFNLEKRRLKYVNKRLLKGTLLGLEYAIIVI